MGVSVPLLLAGGCPGLSGDLEQSHIAFETLLGSKDKADAFIVSLQKFMSDAVPVLDLEEQASGSSPTEVHGG